jgi:hypothetical protein
MGEASDAIERHIRETRGELEKNVEELEFRVKRAADWRRQVGLRPLGAMSAAFAGGVLASMIFGSRQNSNGHRYSNTPVRQASNPRLRRAFGNLQGAALAFASMEVKKFLGRTLAASKARAESRAAATGDRVEL